MLLRFLLKKLGPEKMTEELVAITSGSAYKTFIEEKFRQPLDFERQTQTEQDRFFNELVVTTLILCKYTLDTALTNQEKEEDRLYWRTVKKAFLPAYLVWLANLKIPQKFVKVWGKLLDLRLAEYDQDKVEMRRQMMESKEFQDQVLNVRFIRVHVLAIGCLRHLRRGKETPKDPLFLYLLKWLTDLNKKLEKLCL